MKKIITLIALITCCTKLSQAQYTLWGMTSKGGSDNIGCIIGCVTGSSSIGSQYSFTYSNPGKTPVHTKLMQTSTGRVFGMTSAGGYSDLGVIFEYDVTTNTYTRKVNFAGATSGSNPLGSLAEFTPSGKLYGLTSSGGAGGFGVLFEYDPVTNIYVKKFEFDGALNGSHPHGSLVLASNNKFYGMTYDGGATGFGVLFEYDPVLDSYTKKLDFTGPANGKNPNGSLIAATDLKLYGMTENGGASDLGVIFQYDPISNIFVKKFDFTGAASGQNPKGSLFQATNGKLYGLTSSGGASSAGALFEYDPALSSFTKKIDLVTATGSTPNADLVQHSNGKLYGMTEDGGFSSLGVLFEYDILSNTYTNKLSFLGASTGSAPKGSLFKATSGKLYGLTTTGGLMGAGVIYEYDPTSGTFTKKIDLNILPIGANPNGGLNMISAGGKYYGMTSAGGNNNLGTLFEYDPKTNVLVKKLDFAGASNGAKPQGGLVEISPGVLIGMTSEGGTSNLGVLFSYTIASGTLSKLVDFDGAAKGAKPYGDVSIFMGKLYGMTKEGGTSDFGVLFEYNVASSTYTKKVDFDGAAKGKYPFGTLTLASTSGLLYGVTNDGGASNLGVLFEFNPTTSVFTKRVDFDGATLGANPTGSPIFTTGDFLAGVTSKGGASGFGVAYTFDCPTNTYNPLVHLTGGANPSTPYSTLCQVSGGDFYAMSFDGGADNIGTIFEYVTEPLSIAVTKKVDLSGPANGASPMYSKLIEDCMLPLDASPIVGTNSICIGSSSVYSLSISTISNATSYTWTAPAGASILSGIGTNSITIDYSALAAGVYTIGVYGYNYCGNGTTSVLSLSVNPYPTVTIVPSSTMVCIGSTGTLTASGALTYTWSPGGAFTSSITINPIVPTNYTVIGSSLGCTDTKTITITVNPTPTVVASPTSVTLCVGDITTLSASGATTYSWSSGQLTNTASVNPSSTTVYTVTGTTLGCSDSKTVNVLVNPLPTLTLSLSAPTNTICKGTAVVITASGANTYTWNSGAKTSTVNVAPSVATSYTVLGTDANGCIGTNTIAISLINPTGTLVVVSSSSVLCSGETVSITASGASTYTWSTGDIIDAIVKTPTTSTSYSVLATDNVGCISSKTVNVTVRPLPTVSIGNDVEMLLGASYRFNPTSSGVSYTWSPASGLNNPNIINPITSTQTDITYTLTVTGLNGCTASDDVHVKLITDLIISNYMSPNYDGVNDSWIVNIPLLIKDYSVEIRDSWGKTVFSVQSNYNNEWDAYEQPDGVYFYTIKDGGQVKFQGSITVTR